MMTQAFYVIIERGIIATGHGREVLYSLNATGKRFILKLTLTMKLPGEKGYETQMVIHTGIRTSDVSLAKEFQKHLLHVALKHGVIDKVR